MTGGEGGAQDAGAGAGGGAGQGGLDQGLAGAGGLGGAQSGWLEPCADNPGWCPDDYPTCATVAVAEGEPTEKRCTFLCEDAADETACSELGGQCRVDCGGCLMACGPML